MENKMICNCGFITENKKSWSNHKRYGCVRKEIQNTDKCLYCGNTKPIKKPSNDGKFCNNVCYGNWRSENLKGINAPNYIHGKCNDNLLFRASREYKNWRKKIFKRDDYKCVICGDKKGDNLEADHIKDFALYPELRLNLNNGRTLCKSCHKKTENYGFKKSNTKRN